MSSDRSEVQAASPVTTTLHNTVSDTMKAPNACSFGYAP